MLSIEQLCILNINPPGRSCLGGFPGGVGDATTISKVVDNVMMEKLKRLMPSKVDQPSATQAFGYSKRACQKRKKVGFKL